jgi:chaperonin GroEL
MKHLLSSDARSKILAGVESVASVVAPTLGPRGKYAVLRADTPIITNDGATISSHLKLEDPFEAVGAEVVKGVARNVALIVGDGTTTATILTASLLRLGVESKKHTNDVVKELSASALTVVGEIQKSSRPVKDDELIAIGSRACRSKDMGETIANLINEVGPDSHIFIETSKELSGEVVKGSVFASKPTINQGDIPLPSEPLRDISVLCFDHLFTELGRVVPLIEEMIELGKKELLVICEGIDGEALRGAISNHSRGSFTIHAYKVENIKEASIVFGARFFQAHETGNPGLDDLGGAERVAIAKDRLVVIKPRGSVAKAIASLKGEGQPEEIIKRRTAQLSGHIGFLTLLSYGETDLEDKKLRADDGIRACQAALRGGVVDGGGVAYTNAADSCNSDIMSESLKSIQKTINENAGEEVPTNGVVDPTLVITTALIHSTTAACQLLSVESILL